MKRACLPLAIVAMAAGVCVSSEPVPPTNAPSGFAPQMRESAYAPQKKRDPFLRTDLVAQKKPIAEKNTVPTPPPSLPPPPKPEIPPSAFRLQACLRDRAVPVALVNGKVLELNKVVMMQIGSAEFPVKAVEIGLERVVLDVDGQRVEVRMEDALSLPKQK
ncbi:MAG: hypothetical protein FJ395_03010 [Verrucomicrobia bacterium]|nr:hypothetical protein [Verrucomicrobiota bacterium]